MLVLCSRAENNKRNGQDVPRKAYLDGAKPFSRSFLHVKDFVSGLLFIGCCGGPSLAEHD